MVLKIKLGEIAFVLTRRCAGIPRSTVDHQGKREGQVESDRKRTLGQFGYPPDMQLLATEMVLEQAEKIAAELAA